MLTTAATSSLTSSLTTKVGLFSEVRTEDATYEIMWLALLRSMSPEILTGLRTTTGKLPIRV